MSQIERDFTRYLGKHPEISKCYLEGLINRRSLARHLVKKAIVSENQLDATIAMLRRFNFESATIPKSLSNLAFKLHVKDRILIAEFSKNPTLIKQLQTLLSNTKSEFGETLKIIIGSRSVKVFIDEEHESRIKNLYKVYEMENKLNNISEISLTFDKMSTSQKGILAVISNELLLNDIPLIEVLTNSPELLVYVNDTDAVKAYEILKSISF